jgi:hypothetical protein
MDFSFSIIPYLCPESMVFHCVLRNARGNAHKNSADPVGSALQIFFALS